jgi:NAD(P)H-hydrate epimerase
VQPLSGEEAGKPPQIALLERIDIEKLLPRRPQDSHKGSNGRALLCVGSGRYTGAALLCAGAALRAGAGLTTAAVPGAVKPAFSALPEVMAAAVNDAMDWDEDACLHAGALLPGKDAVCVGCGVGSGDIVPLIEQVLRSKIPAVLDADALNQLAKKPELFGLLHEKVVLTPHPAEMSRLCGEALETILADPIEIAERFAQKWNCVVLLKGATTCIARGDRVRISATGNPGLAKGGSGDVLSGLITGLIAQGIAPFDGACCGACLLGESADAALELLKERMLIARDVVDAIERTICGNWQNDAR